MKPPRKRILILSLLIVALIQLFVPAEIAYQKIYVGYKGKEYKFKITPIDPGDPFKGRYITLNYSYGNKIYVENTENWSDGEFVYITFKDDNDGYAVAERVSKTQPENTEYYVKGKIYYIDEKLHQIVLSYPFNKYYMQEYKAEQADKLIRYGNWDNINNKTFYALIAVNNGDYIIKGVFLDNKPIEDYFK